MVTVPLNPSSAETNSMIVHTPILDRGTEEQVTILASARMVERVTAAALDIDGYIADDKLNALESWIGRFATNELYDNGMQVAGWSSSPAEIVDTESATEERPMPFLIFAGPPNRWRLINKEHELYQTEQRFSARVMAFLLEKGIIE